MMEHKSQEPGIDAAPPPSERVVYVLPQDDQAAPNGGIDLLELWRIICQGKWILQIVTLLFAVAGAAYAFLAPQWYRAEVLLMPAEDKTASGLAGQLGQLSGLASLAGITLGGGSGHTEALAVLRSKGFAREFIVDQGLMPVLLAKDWDPIAKKWKGPEADWPDIRDAVKYFDDKVRRISEDRRTGIVTLGIEWKDPEVAAAWANLVATRVNDQMRQRALADARTNIDYLQSEIAETNLVALQQAIGRLLELELQKYMFAKGNVEFAFRVIDEAQVPKKRSKPLRALVVSSSIVLGVLVAVAIILFRHYARSRSGIAAV